MSNHSQPRQSTPAVPGPRADTAGPQADAADPRREATGPLIPRRDVLRAAVLGAVAVGSAVVVSGCAPSSGSTGGQGSLTRPGGTASPQPSATAGGAAAATPVRSAAAAATPLGILVGTVAEVRAAGFKPYNDPQTGAPGVLVPLASGGIGSWDNRCTHAYCAVPYDAARKLLVCPCHSAEFDPNNDAAVVKGPATTALKPLPVKVDGAGNIYR